MTWCGFRVGMRTTRERMEMGGRGVEGRQGGLKREREGRGGEEGERRRGREKGGEKTRGGR